MSNIVIDHNICTLCGICIETCPFNAMEMTESKVTINAACRVCRICIKNCPEGAINLAEQNKVTVDKSAWKGVMVYVEHDEGKIHPVTYELIGKAKELAHDIDHPVYCLLMGSDIEKSGEELLYYGVDKVFLYDEVELKQFKVDIYTNVFKDCIDKVKPSIVLIGGTPNGRSLAPAIATRCRTGLTADCTRLEVKPNTDLVQIRPAFGGNIMAQIITPSSRPQFATVRYKVMDSAKRSEDSHGSLQTMEIAHDKLESNIDILNIRAKERELDISEADVIVAAGRGVKRGEDLKMLEELASLLGGELAVTRPLVEAGWASHSRQIGLSGRTVKPKLIIACGISGAVQFTAGMDGADTIVAINENRNAPIFNVAHYGVVGDFYEIVPTLIERIKGGHIDGV